jgi:hypothetical protein
MLEGKACAGTDMVLQLVQAGNPRKRLILFALPSIYALRRVIVASDTPTGTVMLLGVIKTVCEILLPALPHTRLCSRDA